jgi:hypothetical protein
MHWHIGIEVVDRYAFACFLFRGPIAFCGCYRSLVLVVWDSLRFDQMPELFRCAAGRNPVEGVALRRQARQFENADAVGVAVEFSRHIPRVILAGKNRTAVLEAQCSVGIGSTATSRSSK